MALKTFDCACGESYDGLTHVPGGDLCPRCNAKGTSQFTPCTFAHSTGYDYDGAPKGEIELALKNKAYIEKNRDKVRSGEIAIKEAKGLPSALRPVI